MAKAHKHYYLDVNNSISSYAGGLYFRCHCTNPNWMCCNPWQLYDSVTGTYGSLYAGHAVQFTSTKDLSCSACRMTPCEGGSYRWKDKMNQYEYVAIAVIDTDPEPDMVQCCGGTLHFVANRAASYPDCEVPIDVTCYGTRIALTEPTNGGAFDVPLTCDDLECIFEYGITFAALTDICCEGYSEYDACPHDPNCNSYFIFPENSMYLTVEYYDPPCEGPCEMWYGSCDGGGCGPRCLDCEDCVNEECVPQCEDCETCVDDECISDCVDCQDCVNGECVDHVEECEEGWIWSGGEICDCVLVPVSGANQNGWGWGGKWRSQNT